MAVFLKCSALHVPSLPFFFGSNYFELNLCLYCLHYLILFRNKLIGSQPSIIADKHVHIRLCILCIYNSRHVCDLNFVSSIKWRK